MSNVSESRYLRMAAIIACIAAMDILARSNRAFVGDAQWNESDHPRDADGKFGKGGGGGNQESKPPIMKSLNDVKEVRQGKNRLPITKGTTIQRKVSFAGRGSKKPLREENRLISQFGGKKGQWSHESGEGFVDFRGESKKAEIHWFSEPSVGIVSVKRKRWL